MIDVTNLTKKYDGVTAVDALTFHVGEGEIFGFLGPNGAGKTTTIRMLCGLIAITSGEVRIAGYQVGDSVDSLELRKIIGLVPDNVGLYDELTAYENLNFYGKLYDCPANQRKENIEQFLDLMGLWDKRNLFVGDFSKGMRQKVAIARALIHGPKILFLDEPTVNLDPESAKAVRDIILGLKRHGRTIFFNTHNLDEAQRMCDRIAILKTRILAVDTPANLEKSVLVHRTAFQLKQITAPILAAVRKSSPKDFAVEGDTITITTPKPVSENPDLIRTIVQAGGEILYVTELKPQLEEVYLRIIRAQT